MNKQQEPSMNNSCRKRKVLAVIAMSLSGLFLLSACNSGLLPLPDKKRYQYINEVKDDLGYDTIDGVVDDRYDTGDGVFSPSFFRAELESPEAFDTLTKRVQTLSDVKCAALSPTQTRCDIEQVEVQITKNDSGNDSVTLEITDVFNGRDPE
jgi:hypothetical protein